MLEMLPRRLVILGAGAIGMEFAYVMNSFGVEVTLVEMLDTILPLEDSETVEVVRRDFVKKGVKILTGTRAEGLERKPEGAVVRLSGKDGAKTEVEADQVLVAVGRAPNTENLGLEALGIRTEKGFIPVGDYGQTAVPSIYAIGDVVATPLLAHVASKEGEIAVERMAGKDPERRVALDEIPSAVYCEPQVGSFGLTERESVERGVRFQKAVFPYRGIGKAVAVEALDGIVKILHDPQTGEILGAHVAGAEATELVHELLLAKKSELTVQDIAGMIHAHPTLSEGVMEAARLAEGWAIHI
ncbi:MAG TPA: FAD-dependent oxidoreductase, partial [Spirochaetia bacterium]|nr:FAD-dependent oxidoreductase [Spirochaetia bacterium]